jgi:nucleoporin NUP2
MHRPSDGLRAQNFSLYDGLDPTLRDKTVGFVGRDEEGKPLNFNVRVKTAEQAAELKGAIDREVQGVKDSA